MLSESTENSSNNSSNSTKNQDRLFGLMERWLNEAAETRASLQATQRLTQTMSDALVESKQITERLEVQFQETTVALHALTEQSREEWAAARKLEGIKGMVDWALDRIQKQPMAVAFLLMVLITIAILSVNLGWDLPALFGLKAG